MDASVHETSASSIAYPKRVQVMGVPIDPWTMRETVSKVEGIVREGVFAHVIGVNADKLLQMRDDPEMDAIVRSCEIVNADGASMVVAAAKLGVVVPERVSGIDLMLELCEVSSRNEFRLYLLGAKKTVVEEAKRSLERQFPGVNIVGYRDGYFAESDYERIGRELAEALPDIVFVGITSPKKERLIEFFRDMGLKGVYVGVGGSFDVVSGSIPRAPEWMQKAKLEWAFRMIQEPKRLVKRYAVGNIRFLMLLASEVIRTKKEPTQ